MSGGGITPEEAAEWLSQVPPEVITGALVPYMLTGSPRYLVEWPAGLPHDPMWNLIPRYAGVPYECTWHGLQVTGLCPDCVREHAEYLETGTWEDRR